tara:strand:- start:69 stop:278 length:210 start_codon:yes stop_codon:yes gene_type:complete
MANKDEVKDKIAQSRQVEMQVESRVSDIIDAALAACDRAKSQGEVRRIKRLANEKIRFYTQMTRKEDYM